MARYTEQQRQDLIDAIASGSLSVRHGDKMVMYRTQSDMMKVLEQMEAEMFGEKRRKKTHGYISFSRGDE